MWLDNNYYLDVLLNDLLIITFYTTFWEFVMNTFDRDRRYSGICFQGMEFAKDINQGSWIGLISNYPLPAVGSGQLEIKTHPIMLKLFFTQGVCLEQHNLIWKRFLDCVTVPFRQGLMVLSHLLVSATNCWCFCLKSVPFRFTSSTLDHQPTIIPSRRSIRTQSYGDKDWFSSLYNCVWPDLGFAIWDGWQFYVEEVKGTVNYQGFILPRRRGEFPDAHTQLLTVQFDWNGVRKDQSSVLMGVSPEFEVALYTLCFYAGQEDNYVDLGPYRVNVKCYRLGQEKIGSAFPIALD